MTIQPARTPQSGWLFRTAKAAIELAVVWTVVGYISLRAFCNYHEVPLISLSPERYAEETYALVAGSIVEYVHTGWFLGAVICISLLCCLLPLVPTTRLKHVSHEIVTERFISGLLFVLVLCSALGFGRIALFLVDLQDEGLAGRIRSPHLDPYFSYDVLIALFICGAWLFFHPSNSLLPEHRLTFGQQVMRRLLAVFAALTVFFIPVLYGASLQKREVYIVKLELADSKEPVCALRLLESSTQLIFWNASNQTGSVRSIPVSKLASVEYLSSTRLSTQMDEALRNPRAPSCDQGVQNK
jgi:hypothetical protein